jgi:hypothetical protein
MPLRSDIQLSAKGTLMIRNIGNYIKMRVEY